MEIRWNDIGLEEWDRLLKAAPKSSLLQSWPYAQMMRVANQMSTRFGRVVEGEQTIAIFQLHEVKLTSFYHVVVLDRGPVWLFEKVTDKHWQEFTKLLDREFPKRFGRRRRFMPELESSIAKSDIAQDTSFKKKAKGYQSIWVDLRKSEEELRAGLKQKWRNTLNQSFKKDMRVDVSDSSFNFNWLVSRYDEDRKKRSYQGPSVTILKNLYKYCKPREEVLMLSAISEHVQISGILIFKHGSAATYQIGWTSDKGRELRAHHRLLWQAMCHLKEEGIEWLDLGGINPEDAAGVTKFKEGISQQSFELVGLYS